jgi:uncharacterized protein (DUF305 family)
MKTILTALLGIVIGYGASGFYPMSQLKEALLTLETPDMSGGHELNTEAKVEDHSAHSATTAAPADASGATKAFMAANDLMHTNMAIAYSGNVDADFVKGMIPHHQGAIDMAKVALQFGTDAEVKTLAEGVISAQEGEIAQMRQILTRLGQ